MGELKFIGSNALVSKADASILFWQPPPFHQLHSLTPHIVAHIMGPYECLGQRAFRLMQANSRSAAVVQLHHRPIQVQTYSTYLSS